MPISEARQMDWSEPEVNATLWEGFYLPFLKAARKRLADIAGDPLGLVNPRACSEPERSLIRRLAAIFFGIIR